MGPLLGAMVCAWLRHCGLYGSFKFRVNGQIFTKIAHLFRRLTPSQPGRGHRSARSRDPSSGKSAVGDRSPRGAGLWPVGDEHGFCSRQLGNRTRTSLHTPCHLAHHLRPTKSKSRGGCDLAHSPPRKQASAQTLLPRLRASRAVVTFLEVYQQRPIG